MTAIDRTKFHRQSMLGKDGAAADQCATRLAGLLGFIRHAANDCADHATAARLREWAQGLADVTHNDLAAVMVAHEVALAEEGVEGAFVLDPVLLVTFGMALPKGAELPSMRAAE